MDRLRKYLFKKFDFRFFASLEHILYQFDGKVGRTIYKFYLYKIFKPYEKFIGWKKFKEGMRLYDYGWTIKQGSFEIKLREKVKN